MVERHVEEYSFSRIEPYAGQLLKERASLARLRRASAYSSAGLFLLVTVGLLIGRFPVEAAICAYPVLGLVWMSSLDMSKKTLKKMKKIAK